MDEAHRPIYIIFCLTMDAIFPNFAAFQWFYGNIVAGFSKKALVIKDVNSEGCDLMKP